MEKLNRKELDDRIHNFLLKKTSSHSDLGQRIADWISGFGGSSEKSAQHTHYRGQAWAEYVLKMR